MKRFATLAGVLCLCAAPSLATADDVAVSLSGSRASMLRQNRVAKDEMYSFLRTPTQVLRFVDGGHLVELTGNDNYSVIAGYPFARPVVRSFVERLAADYRQACGERLVVTSLTRPAAQQPRNASPLSVHPAGMAVDLRVSARVWCRDWLSQELLELENRGILDATRENRPPHFHVAVFPAPFERYDQELTALADAEEAMRRLEQAGADRLAAEAVADEAAEATSSAEQAARVPLVLRLAAVIASIVLPLPV